MPWDDELDRLARFVREHFGHEALKDVGRRAMATLTPLDDTAAAESERDDVIEGADGQFYDIDAFWDAVRRELRRLVTPQ